VNDLRQRAQGLIDFPWVLKDCGHVRIKRDDARALLVTGRVLVGSRPAEIVFGENVIPVSLGCITRFTKVSLQDFSPPFLSSTQNRAPQYITSQIGRP
jgi:hypothetical protein